MLSALFIFAAAFAQTTWESKLALRHSIMEQAAQTKAHREQGVAENFVGFAIKTSLNDLTPAGQTGLVPWSGYFWPNYRGGLAYRWADPAFPRTDWGEANRYVQSFSWDRVLPTLLSPAEKYDLATGLNPTDVSSLATHQWNLGRNEYATTGKVATWQGICHGWSPASIFLPTPKRPVSVNTSRGSVVFGLDDIKALGSLYYANGKFDTVYAGWRCNAAAPATDAEGRITEQECFDVNPADWHLVLTNLVGLNQRPFLIDAQNSEQVWNKPVTAYRMEFFDVADYRVKSSDFRKVLRQRARLGRLRFATYRAPETVWVVGVKSIVKVGDGQAPGVHMPDSKEIAYTYDLELDNDYNIIGGEWREGEHPDFLWRPAFDVRPASTGDQTRVDVTRFGDQNWRNAALKSSPRGVPLKAFVDYLFQQSQF